MGTQRSQQSEQRWLKSEARERVWRHAELTAERVVHRRDQEDHHRDEHRDQPGDHQVRAQFRQLSNANSPNLSNPSCTMTKRTQPDAHRTTTEVPRNSGHPHEKV
jgi:hypothetical protein